MNLESSTLRKRVYAILATVAAATVAGRILAVELIYEPSVHRSDKEPLTAGRPWPAVRPLPMPTFGSNDRSRWATVRSLVEEGTYVIGRRDRKVVAASAVSLLGARDGVEAAVLAAAGYAARTRSDVGLVTQDGWQTVDKVLHPDKLEYYSSKPPLLATVVAGLYWLLYRLDWTLENARWTVVGLILLVVNLLPYLIYLGLLSRLLDRYGKSDWGRLYVFACAAFATLLTTFAITLNNHSIATCSALFALYPALRIWDLSGPKPGPESAGAQRPPPRYLFMLAGFFAAFTAANELPAVAYLVLLGTALLVRVPGRTLAYFVPAAAVPIAAFFLTNYLAIGQWRPAYDEFGGVWYEYEGSHWRKPAAGEQKSGIDWAGLKETRAEYAFHMLLGHHGLFSLSPIWIIAMAGMIAAVVGLRSAGADAGPEGKQPAQYLHRGLSPPSGLTAVAWLTLALTLVVVGFYLIKSDNYGGWTSGLRWLIWLSPLWLLAMLPLADRLGATRWGRGLALALLAWSVVSVAYSARNPWRHPWLYNFMQGQGWIPY
jgi:hypothetical protein